MVKTWDWSKQTACLKVFWLSKELNCLCGANNTKVLDSSKFKFGCTVFGERFFYFKELHEFGYWKIRQCSGAVLVLFKIKEKDKLYKKRLSWGILDGSTLQNWSKEKYFITSKTVSNKLSGQKVWLRYAIKVNSANVVYKLVPKLRNIIENIPRSIAWNKF